MRFDNPHPQEAIARIMADAIRESGFVAAAGLPAT